MAPTSQGEWVPKGLAHLPRAPVGADQHLGTEEVVIDCLRSDSVNEQSKNMAKASTGSCQTASHPLPNSSPTRFPAPEGPRKCTIWAENISKKESVLPGPADNRIAASTALPSQAKHGNGRDSLKAGPSQGQTQGGEVCSSLRLCPLGSSPNARLLQLCKLFPSTGPSKPRADLRAPGRASATHRVTEALRQGTSGLLLCQGEGPLRIMALVITVAVT
ncbi:uncharacterized protein ACBT57_007784 [Dama dama]